MSRDVEGFVEKEAGTFTGEVEKPSPRAMNIKEITITMGIGLAFAANSMGQTNLQFIRSRATEEHAPIMTWRSQSNALYRIDYATALVNSNTVWNTLYDEYPSHGTNTFIADAGNYDVVPVIPHP